MGEVLVKMVLVTPQKNVRQRVELTKAHVRPVMEFAALVSLKIALFFTEFHGIFSFFSVTSRCGATSSENCTYFESSGAESGACRLKICKCSSNICQVSKTRKIS